MSQASYGDPVDRDEQAVLWYLEFAEGELSAERQRAFDLWLADAPNHEAFRYAAMAWDATEAASTSPELVQMRSGALDAYRRSQMQRWRDLPATRRGLVATFIATAAVLLAIIGWNWLPETQTYATPIGERRVAMLEDGSRLSLDADSVVEAQFDERRRTMTLEKGRARFDVAHNPLRPFTVLAGDKLVVATGTSFTVERIGNEVHVLLIEGRVSVVDQADGAEPGIAAIRAGVDLSAGRVLVLPAVGPGRPSVTPIQSERPETWQQGQVSFEDTPLPMAVERMNRYLREPLVVGDSATGRVRVTGVFDGADSQGFTESLQALHRVRAERRNGKVVLTGG